MKRVAQSNFMDYSDSSSDDDGPLFVSKNKYPKMQGKNAIKKTPSQPKENFDLTLAKKWSECEIESLLGYNISLKTSPSKTSNKIIKKTYKPGTSFIILHHPGKHHSNYEDEIPPYIAFEKMNVSFADFCTGMGNYYNKSYGMLNSSIDVKIMLSPTESKILTIPQEKRNSPNEISIFHYIGFGFPDIEEMNIQICGKKSTDFRPYPIKSIYEMMKTPSCFIFDCNNAGLALEGYDLIVNDKSDDFYCICATDGTEKLPKDPHLPRDFLTTCLLNPVSMSILWHILQYHRKDFDDPEFPINQINGILALEDDTQIEQMNYILSSLIEAIAADYLRPELFNDLFRKDKIIASLFRNFILAQYLSVPYEVHPVSKPYIPNMNRHNLWKQWQMYMEQWVTTKDVSASSFVNRFFAESLSIFLTTIENDMTESLQRSMIAIICNIPTTKIKTKKDVYKPLVECIEKSEKCMTNIKRLIQVHNLFREIPKTKEPELYSLCRLVFILIIDDSSILHNMGMGVNYDGIFSMIFDPSVTDKTKVLIAAILTLVIGELNNAKTFVIHDKFFKMVNKALNTASMDLLHWLLILIMQVFQCEKPDMETFVKESVHLYLGAAVFHSLVWCRASAISCLSTFIKPGNQEINLYLVLLAIPALSDASYLVRLQFFHLAKKFLYQHMDMLSSGHLSSRIETTSYSYSQIISLRYDKADENNIPKNYEQFVKYIDEIVHKDDAYYHVCYVLYGIIDMFAHDPFPKIRKMASKERKIFQKLINKGNMKRRKSLSSNINVQAKDLSDDESSMTEESFETTEKDVSDLIYDISLNKLLDETPSKRINAVESKVEDLSIVSKLKIEMKNKSSLFQTQAKFMTFHPNNRCMALSTPDNCVFSLDEEMRIVSRLMPSKYKITDLDYTYFNSTSLIITATGDGCVYLWDSKNDTSSGCFRADANYNCDNIPQKVASNGANLFAARGNSGISLWDLRTQKIVSEWKSEENCLATALGLHSSNPSIAVVGYSNGSIGTIDIRSVSNKMNRVSNVLKTIVTNISSINDLVYITANDGTCAIWNTEHDVFSPLNSGVNALKQFTVHSEFPIAIIDNENEAPKLTSSDGIPFHSFDDVLPQSKFCFHKRLPTAAFCTQKGDLITYDFF